MPPWHPSIPFRGLSGLSVWPPWRRGSPWFGPTDLRYLCRPVPGLPPLLGLYGSSQAPFLVLITWHNGIDVVNGYEAVKNILRIHFTVDGLLGYTDRGPSRRRRGLILHRKVFGTP